MPRALRYHVDDVSTNTIADDAWANIARMQHWYNAEFIWTCDRIGLKRYILFPHYERMPEMPYHIARYHFRKRLLQKKVELRDEIAAVRAIEETGLFTVRWGGVRDNALASGITHVADNEFNAYLLCEFLLKCSTVAREATFEVEDEGRFILPGRAMFRDGQILVRRSDLERAGQEIHLEQPQVFAVVNATRYDDHPSFSQSVEDFDELDDAARIESISRQGALGFANNFETAWGDGEGLNLQQRARAVVLLDDQEADPADPDLLPPQP